MARLRSLLPALVLGALAFSAGTFHGAVAWPQGPIGQLLLLLLALAGLAEAGDPLRLGSRLRWLPWLLWAAVAVSVAASPVPRAGRVALALLPVFLLLPAATARLLGGRGRSLGLAAWSAVVAATAAVGLADALRSAVHRAALPLGHHNLMGAFLVMTLPVAALSLRERGLPRALAVLATLLGLGALAATRSLSALGTAALLVVLATPRLGRLRRLALGLVLLGLGLGVPRLEGMLRGRDDSLAARRIYAEAAVAGFAARPLAGWGAGSTPWRLAEHVRPEPGINPPGELVGEAHSLPLALLFELGLAGALAAAATLAAFALRRWRGRRAATDPELLAAGLLGLAGGIVVAFGDAWLAVPALPCALALTAGAALAGAGAAPARPPRAGALLAAVLLAAGAAALIAPARAHRRWEAARRAPDRAAAAVELAAAAKIDPAFPLYAARWSWIAPGPAGERARVALAAAEAAGAVAPFWLRAGELAWEAGDAAAARHALGRALALDPLSGVAPFLLFIASQGTADDCAGRALVAEPRLLAATYWRSFPAARRRAEARVGRWPGLTAGWRQSFRAIATAAMPGPAGGEEVDLATELDRTPALSASLHLFRRSPLAVDLARIRLDRATLRRVRLPSSAWLPESSPAAFPPGRCAPVDVLAPMAEAPGEPLFRDGFESGDHRRWQLIERP